MGTLADLAKEYDAWVGGDSCFQRRTRVLQSIWRVEQGYPIGLNGSTKLGSRLAMPWACETLGNYLSQTIRRVVRDEIENEGPKFRKVYTKPRIYDNLLSSQPLCFNMFAELQQDLYLATKVLGALTQGRVEKVTTLEFEHSPCRGDNRYTGDKTAFDVYATFETASQRRGFLGIEVKYHESLGDKPARHRCRYDEIAEIMGCFKTAGMPRLRQRPLQQIWRDHLLAGSILNSDKGVFDEGLFVFVYPKDNAACHTAVVGYTECLLSSETFIVWTLEEVVSALQQHTQAKWVDDFRDRYLNFDKLAQA